jgi:hypothetical protein
MCRRAASIEVQDAARLESRDFLQSDFDFSLGSLDGRCGAPATVTLPKIFAKSI